MRGHYEVTSGLIQNAPIELKFDMNDPEVNLNILKIPWVNLRSLRGLYEVNSSLIQNAPIELIFDMNNTFVILHMLIIQEIIQGHRGLEGHEVTSSVTTHSHLSSESKRQY